MATNDDTLITVASVPSEMEGHLLANILNESGIPATVTGGFTAQFRAEAPGSVRVLVRQERAAAAKSVLAQRMPRSEASAHEEHLSADYQPRLTQFAIRTLLCGGLIAIAGVLAYLLTGGDLMVGISWLVVSIIPVIAIATLRWWGNR
jgi:hypothetical protein